MSDAPRRKGLGRGLAALIEDVRPDRSEALRADATAPIERIHPNPNQPRKRFDDADLAALAESIRARGIVQPLIVRPDPDYGEGHWQIVAGERRWRAAQMAQVHEAPIVVRVLDDMDVLEIGILENVQRADLNPIEEATGYAQLVQKFGHTQERLASAMGKSRSYIANALRLLSLPDAVQAMARDGQLTAGHARALITAADPLALAQVVVARGLSVRETEQLAKTPVSAAAPARPRPPGKDADTRALEADLGAALGLRVAIQHRGDKGGELRIAYKDLEQLDGLCRLLAR